jgi:superfamily II RNA helicase
MEQSEKDADKAPTTIRGLSISEEAKSTLEWLNIEANKCMSVEDKLDPTMSPHNYWSLTLFWIEPILRWIRGEDISILCKEYEIFEGNFTRVILKANNLLDEWLSLATFCDHTSQIEKIVAVKSQLVRDIVLPDSLYLRL